MLCLLYVLPCVDQLIPHVCLQSLLMGVKRNKGGISSPDLMVRLFSGGCALMPKLEYLCLQHRGDVRTLCGIELLSETLTVLDLRGCNAIAPEEYIRCSKLHRLEQLFVGSPLGQSVLCEISRGCARLKALDISCCELSHEFVDLLCCNQVSLERLKLTRCTSLTNEWLRRLLCGFPNLRLIDVSHCWRLSDSFVDGMGRIASPRMFIVYIDKIFRRRCDYGCLQLFTGRPPHFVDAQRPQVQRRCCKAFKAPGAPVISVISR